MHDERNANDEQRRKLMLLGAGAAVVGGWACGAVPYKPDPVGGPRISDEIYALGLPIPKLLERLESKDVIALLGKNQTYLVLYHGQLIANLAKSGTEKFRFNADNESLFVQGRVFWGRITLFPIATGIEAYGVVLPPVDATELSSKEKVLPLTFREPRLSDSPPNLGIYAKNIPMSVFVNFSSEVSTPKLGGFPVYSISATH